MPKRRYRACCDGAEFQFGPKNGSGLQCGTAGSQTRAATRRQPGRTYSSCQVPAEPAIRAGPYDSEPSRNNRRPELLLVAELADDGRLDLWLAALGSIDAVCLGRGDSQSGARAVKLVLTSAKTPSISKKGPSLRRLKSCASSGVGKRVTVHTLRHTFATHLLEGGTDIRIIQALLGHRNVNTMARYAQVATSTIRGTPSPLDRLRLEVMPPH